MGGTGWRGVTLDQRTAAMMDEVTRLAPQCPIWPTQGSYSGGVGASAGTHDGGGAIDLAGEDMTPSQRTEVETRMREVGFAAWIRSPSQSDWPWHIHGIAVACPDLSPAAADQVDDYMAGRNGLAGNGPDTGTRAYVGVTWETYQQEHGDEEDDMKPWVVTAGGSVWVTDLATYKCWIAEGAVASEGVALGAYQYFAGGAALGQGWVDHIDRLPRVDA